MHFFSSNYIFITPLPPPSLSGYFREKGKFIFGVLPQAAARAVQGAAEGRDGPDGCRRGAAQAGGAHPPEEKAAGAESLFLVVEPLGRGGGCFRTYVFVNGS